MAPPPPSAVTAPAAAAKRAAGDTVYVLGGPYRDDGKFQRDDVPELPDDEGWVPLGQFADPAGPYWHVDTFNAASLDPARADNHAMWCGHYLPPCGNEPTNPGYAGSVTAYLGWHGAVAEPSQPATVHLTARLNHDSEPFYDYLYLEVERAGGWEILRTWDGNNKTGGVFVPVDVDVSLVTDPTDYTGPQADRVHLRWRFASDGGYDDSDCLYPTDGAAQVDNVVVSFDQGSGPVTVSEDDFEPGSEVSWAPEFPLCSLAKVWPRLADVGVCGTNLTPQLAFIDDGSACFSDGTLGTTWTYGPGGHVAYCRAGGTALHPDAFWSPPILLPPDVADYDGARLEWDAYVHGTVNGSPLIAWSLRTSRDGGATWSAWGNLGFIYEHHGPEYRRFVFDVTGLIPAGADRVQVSLGVTDIAGFTDCGFLSPAPYYDNVALKLFHRSGPEVYEVIADGYGLFQSALPAAGTLDPGDPAGHSVRLDSRRGDGMSCGVAVRRRGASPAGPPELHWRLSANPAYDAYRDPPPPNPVLGTPTGPFTDLVGRQGTNYAFDLPDSGFFFPGDVLHYYVEARDDAGGDVGLARLPADTTGFSSFPRDPAYLPGPYDPRFEVRALPSLQDPAAGTQPALLLWLEDPETAELNEWLTTMANLGYRQGRDFDLLKPPYPGPVLFTAGQLAGYRTVIYGSGRLTRAFNSTEGQADLLEAWLALGERNLLICGNNVVRRFTPYYTYWYAGTLGLAGYGPAPYDDVRPYIDQQAAPGVLPVAGNPLGLTVEAIADGSCRYDLFDAMVPSGTGQAILQWAAPGGGPGGYEPVAGIYNLRADWSAQVVTLPFEPALLLTPEGQGGGPIAARTRLLGEILAFFGGTPGGSPTAAPPAERFTLHAHPNPFNPRLNLRYELPRAGELRLRLYDLRGRLVRTLVDGPVPAGAGRVAWEGRDDDGRAVAAGVYVLEARALGRVTRQKVALIR